MFTPTGKIYLCGDIHNEADKLIRLLAQIEPLLTEKDHVVFCGDLIDRGKQPSLTVEVLVSFVRRHPDQVFFVQGNHDFMLQHYLTTGRQDWMEYLKVTLDGWQADWKLADIQPLTVMEALFNRGFNEITCRTAFYYETEEVVATHAPIDISSAKMNGIDKYDAAFAAKGNLPTFNFFLERIRYDIQWGFTGEEIRIPEFKKFRVCGHQFKGGKHPRIFKDRAFIDTGCGKGNNPVTCLVYPGKRYYQGY